MTSFTLNSALTQQVWSVNYIKEYTRISGFMPYMGKSQDSVIRVNHDLTKKAGDSVTIPYFSALSGAGVTGSTALKGSEEDLVDYAIKNTVSQVRNGVLIQESDAYKTDLQLGNIAADALRSWSANKLKTDIISGLGSVPVAVAGAADSTVSYASASEANKDAWNAVNATRMVFGTSTADGSGDHSADLLGIAAGETLSATVLDRLVDKARTTSTFRITPFNSDATAGREYFVFFVGTAGFNQLRADADIKAANREAWTRDEMKNPVFQGGDLLWNGVIVRQIPEISAVGTVGTAGASVSAGYLCGSNAVSVAWGALPEARKDVDDYGEKMGVAIREVRGVKKMTAGLADIGIATAFYATV